MLNRRSFFAASAAGIAAGVLPGVEAKSARESLVCSAYLKDGTRLGTFKDGKVANETGRDLPAGTMIYLGFS